MVMTRVMISLLRLMQANTTATILITSGVRSIFSMGRVLTISCNQKISMMEEQASQAMLLQHRMIERKMLVEARCRWWDTTAHVRVLKVSTSRMEEKIIMVPMG